MSGLYDQFKKTLIGDLTDEGFADAFSQTLIYGLILARFEKGKDIDRISAYAYIPKSFSIIYELFKHFSTEDLPERFDWIYNEIIAVINAASFTSISEELMLTGGLHANDDYDAYWYFYEPFLKKIDAIQKKEKGVYYTPIPVVSFIIRSLDSILKEKFNVQGGFLNEQVTTLDFACGTGTFLAEIFKHIFYKLGATHNKGEIHSKIKEHLLKNFYGFEYLVAPYAIAHLKLSRLIEELAGGYSFGEKERLQIYLTDTLNNSEHTANPLFQAISKEGKKANEIKRKDKILVVTGNPPYSRDSKNKSKWLDENLSLYKFDNNEEQNQQPLNDDYIKFIRFAHYKIAQNGKGVIGIITNNSFINGLIHRKLRAELLKEFDEIYILNLYGKQNKKGDENVFPITSVNVAIIFLIKTGEEKTGDGKVYYFDSPYPAKREEKFNLLRSNDIDSINWKELYFSAFDNEFKKTRWSNRFSYLKFFAPMEDESMKLTKIYGEFWGIFDIFNYFKINGRINYGSGVKAHGDDYKISFESDELLDDLKKILLRDSSILAKLDLSEKKIEEVVECLKDIKDKENEYIIDINYRPFDIRKILYKHGFIERDRIQVMQHFLAGENVGMVVRRTCENTEQFKQAFVTDKLLDINCLSAQTYVVPLYLYESKPENFLVETENKNHNFTKEFIEFISQKYLKKPSPEEVFGYIYAILYCPTYRDKYLELLKIDFPRVPFMDDEKLFYELSELGCELVQHHLMKKTYDNLICNYPKPRKEDADLIEKVEKPMKGENPGTIRIWINKDQYFDNIPDEVWNFYIGGYQVLDEWLKARENRTLTNSDINTFKQIVNILDFTIEQMGKINEIAREF